MKEPIGKRVEHEEYGLGTVAYYDELQRWYLVIFDKENNCLHSGGDCTSEEVKKKFPDREERCWWFSTIGGGEFTKIFDTRDMKIIPRRPRRSRGW